MKSTSGLFRFWALIFCIAVLCCAQNPTLASSQSFSASYDPALEILSFEGSTGVSSELLTVSLLPESGISASGELSPANSIIRTLRSGVGGSFDFELGIPSELKSNAYIFRVKGMHSGFDKTYPISYISKTESAPVFAEFKSCVDSNDYAGFKNALSSNSSVLGINPDKASADGVYCKILYDHSPVGGYDIESFYTLQRYASAISDIRNITESYPENLDKVMTGYSLELCADTARYAKVSSGAKTAFVERIAEMSESELSNADRETLYFETMFLSELDATENYSYFREVVESYADSIELSMTKFNSSRLSDSERNSVFKDMYGKKYMSIDAVKEDFEDLTDSFYSDSSSKGSGSKGSSSKGGSGFVSANGIAIPDDNQSITQPDNTIGEYSDTKTHWAKSYITALSAKGIVNGYGNNLFMPDNAVTRAEFTKLVCESFGIAKSDEAIFADVASDAWYFGYVSGAYKAGIVSGYNGSFNPDDLIKREDAAVIICNALKFTGAALYDSNASYLDASGISDYALSSVAYLQSEGIMEGSEGYFNPKSNTTRAEAATLLCRILKLEV